MDNGTIALLISGGNFLLCSASLFLSIIKTGKKDRKEFADLQKEVAVLKEHVANKLDSLSEKMEEIKDKI
jgi:hypothetical protein